MRKRLATALVVLAAGRLGLFRVLEPGRPTAALRPLPVARATGGAPVSNLGPVLSLAGIATLLALAGGMAARRRRQGPPPHEQ